MDANSGAIDIAKQPTGAQERKIREVLELADGGVIDLSDRTGRKAYLEVNSDSIDRSIGKIRRFFRGDEIESGESFLPGAKQDSHAALSKKYEKKFGTPVPSGWSRDQIRTELGIPKPVEPPEKRGKLSDFAASRDVKKEVGEELGMSKEGMDNPEELAGIYFEIGHGKDSKNWIFDSYSNSVQSKSGGTHGINFGHEVADRSFKGWYDKNRDVISVVFPAQALKKIEGKPTVDDIPTNVFNKLQSKFGKTAAMAVFLPGGKPERIERNGKPIIVHRDPLGQFTSQPSKKKALEDVALGGVASATDDNRPLATFK